MNQIEAAMGLRLLKAIGLSNPEAQTNDFKTFHLTWFEENPEWVLARTHSIYSVDGLVNTIKSILERKSNGSETTR